MANQPPFQKGQSYNSTALEEIKVQDYLFGTIIRRLINHFFLQQRQLKYTIDCSNCKETELRFSPKYILQQRLSCHFISRLLSFLSFLISMISID